MESRPTDAAVFFERFLVSDRDVTPSKLNKTSHKKLENDGIVIIDE